MYILMHIMINTSATNQQRLITAQERLSEALRPALQAGFYGNVALEIVIQDGTIQHVRQKTERIDRLTG